MDLEWFLLKHYKIYLDFINQLPKQYNYKFLAHWNDLLKPSFFDLIDEDFKNLTICFGPLEIKMKEKCEPSDWINNPTKFIVKSRFYQIEASSEKVVEIVLRNLKDMNKLTLF